MTHSKYLISLICLIIPVFSYAASMIESRDDNNETTTMLIDGNKARIETSGNDGYLVMDVATKSLKMVINEFQAILDMSDIFTQPPAHTTTAEGNFIDTYTESKGLGPKIAGYETEEYEIFANDKYCGSAFVSIRAVQDTGLRKFAGIFQNLSGHIEKKMSGLSIPLQQPVCEIAFQKLTDKIQTIGFPLRTTNQSKQLTSEVIQINTRSKLPANAFNIPAHYKTTTASEMMKNAAKQIKDASPLIMEMMKNISPADREMMLKKLQQMQR